MAYLDRWFGSPSGSAPEAYRSASALLTSVDA